ncbi:hypothetical protein RSSM_04526 [Rhodopirellula sallentina SM41]|uniref:Uncharacterized protein n=1 Tax=Rhodopirellula sallentina SM41 TaxID=1263870 RepID=M5TXW0_9BACT|nr:hypothetical protein RSSM_04526 [Rhodopirellula sallentina SM41]
MDGDATRVALRGMRRCGTGIAAGHVCERWVGINSIMGIGPRIHRDIGPIPIPNGLIKSIYLQSTDFFTEPHPTACDTRRRLRLERLNPANIAHTSPPEQPHIDAGPTIQRRWTNREIHRRNLSLPQSTVAYWQKLDALSRKNARLVRPIQFGNDPGELQQRTRSFAKVRLTHPFRPFGGERFSALNLRIEHRRRVWNPANSIFQPDNQSRSPFGTFRYNTADAFKGSPTPDRRASNQTAWLDLQSFTASPKFC